MDARTREIAQNIEGTAKMMGISPHTVRSLIRQRRLAHHKVGRRVVVYPSDIETFLQACRIPAMDEK